MRTYHGVKTSHEVRSTHIETPIKARLQTDWTFLMWRYIDVWSEVGRLVGAERGGAANENLIQSI